HTSFSRDWSSDVCSSDLKPLDEDMLLRLASQHKKIIVMEESAELGGLGSAILEFYAKHHIDDMVVRLMGIPDLFVEHGSISEQRNEVGLNAEGVLQVIHNMQPIRRKSANLHI